MQSHIVMVITKFLLLATIRRREAILYQIICDIYLWNVDTHIGTLLCGHLIKVVTSR